MQSNDRAYFKRRSVEEIHAAMRADSVEATRSHVALAELHLRQCAICVAPATEECGDCLAVYICLRPNSAEEAIVQRRPPKDRSRAEPATRPFGLGRRSVRDTREGNTMSMQLAPLSSQEQEILQLMALGFSAREVGCELAATPRAVQRHLVNMRSKLQARNMPHLIAQGFVVGALKAAIED